MFDDRRNSSHRSFAHIGAQGILSFFCLFPLRFVLTSIQDFTDEINPGCCFVACPEVHLDVSGGVDSEAIDTIRRDERGDMVLEQLANPGRLRVQISKHDR